MNTKNIIVLTLALFLVCGPAFAETLILKDGRKITGTIISEEKHRIKIRVGGFPYTYYRDQIDRIVGRQGTPGKPIPLEELVDRSLKAVEDIPESKRELISRYVSINGTRNSIASIFRQILQDVEPAQVETFRKVFNVDEVLIRLFPIYDKYYSEAELKELVNFYSSPVGQKMVQSMPNVMREAMNVTVEYFRERVPEDQR